MAEHEFTEDPGDYSMCMCGRPAIGHPEPTPAAAHPPDAGTGRAGS